MPDLVLLSVKVVLAAFFVALLSHLSSAFRPKLFSGLFAGAPVVAAVSLAIMAVTKPAAVHPSGMGMIAGAAGMIACCVVAAVVVPRAGALAASAAGWAAWGAASVAGFLVVGR